METCGLKTIEIPPSISVLSNNSLGLNIMKKNNISFHEDGREIIAQRQSSRSSVCIDDSADMNCVILPPGENCQFIPTEENTSCVLGIL